MLGDTDLHNVGTAGRVPALPARFSGDVGRDCGRAVLMPPPQICSTGRGSSSGIGGALLGELSLDAGERPLPSPSSCRAASRSGLPSTTLRGEPAGSDCQLDADECSDAGWGARCGDPAGRTAGC